MWVLTKRVVQLFLTALFLVGCGKGVGLDSFFYAPVAETVTVSSLAGRIPAKRIEEVRFRSEDGKLLQGMFATPTTLPGNGITILYYHGNSESIKHYWKRVEILVEELGYPVFIFDYHGYGESEGVPTEDTLRQDGRAAARLLADRSDVDARKIVYYGWSMGAMVAIHTAVDIPPLGLITESPFASSEEIVQDATSLSLPGKWLVNSPLDNEAAIANVYVPKLMMHGSADDFISPKYSQQLYQAAPPPKQLWLVPGADHGNIPDIDRALYLRKITIFLTGLSGS